MRPGRRRRPVPPHGERGAAESPSCPAAAPPGRPRSGRGTATRRNSGRIARCRCRGRRAARPVHALAARGTHQRVVVQRRHHRDACRARHRPADRTRDSAGCGRGARPAAARRNSPFRRAVMQRRPVGLLEGRADPVVDHFDDRQTVVHAPGHVAVRRAPGRTRRTARHVVAGGLLAGQRQAYISEPARWRGRKSWMAWTTCTACSVRAGRGAQRLRRSAGDPRGRRRRLPGVTHRHDRDRADRSRRRRPPSRRGAGRRRDDRPSTPGPRSPRGAPGERRPAR